MGGPGDQFHDFNPGIKPSGLFWTVAFDPSTFDSIPGQGRARLKVPNMAMPDYHDIFNAVLGGSSVPGHVAFEVTWAGGGAARFLARRSITYQSTKPIAPTSNASSTMISLERRMDAR